MFQQSRGLWRSSDQLSLSSSFSLNGFLSPSCDYFPSFKMYNWNRKVQQPAEFLHCFSDLWGMVGKAKGKSLELPLHGDPNQCCIPGSVAEISGIFKDLRDAEVMISTTSSFNSLIWPVMRADSSWRTTMDCNQVLISIVASVPNVSLLEQINTSSST